MGAYVPYNPEVEKFLNNFYTRFPSGTGPFPYGLARFVLNDCWNKTNQERLREIYSHSEEEFQDHCSRVSDRYLAETPEQFFAELDKTVLEVGLSFDQIKERIKTYSAAGDSIGGDDRTNIRQHHMNILNDYLIPVYKALRLKGYNIKELWG
jgi:hypothetical protein